MDRGAPFDPVHPPAMPVWGPAQDFNLGDCPDARKRFTAEPKSSYGVQIIGVIEFAGCVPSKGQGEVIRRDPDAVIADADQSETAAVNFDGDIPRARVDGIFGKFFHYRCRTFHNFTGGDAGNDVGIELADSTHLWLQDL